MSLERLLPLLRCLDCGRPLGREEKHLKCRGCGQVYPLMDGIPVMAREDSEDELWEDYFRRVSGRLGDTEAANRYFSRRNFRFVRAGLLALLGPTRGLIILDVGCGTGHFSRGLARDNLVAGADVSSGMLGFALKKGLAAVQSSGKRLPFGEATFDVVIASNVIQSIQEGGALIRELSRVTRPGGKLLISATNGQNCSLAFIRLFEKKKHRPLKTYAAADLTRFLEEARLEVESVVFLFFPFGLVRKIRGDERARLLEKRLATTVAVLARKPLK